jgi:hypothetical protein
VAFDWPEFWRRTEGYPFKLWLLAEEANVDPEWLETWLTAEVERRQRERYGMHLRAYEALDVRLERIAG